MPFLALCHRRRALGLQPAAALRARAARAPDASSHGRAAGPPAVGSLCLAAALLALLAFDLDPYVLQPAGVMLPLPGRRPLRLAQGLLLALAVLMPLVSRRRPHDGQIARVIARCEARGVPVLDVFPLLCRSPSGS